MDRLLLLPKLLGGCGRLLVGRVELSGLLGVLDGPVVVALAGLGLRVGDLGFGVGNVLRFFLSRCDRLAGDGGGQGAAAAPQSHIILVLYDHGHLAGTRLTCDNLCRAGKRLEHLAGSAGDRPHVAHAFVLGIQVGSEFHLLVHGNRVVHLDQAHPFLPDFWFRAGEPWTGDTDPVLLRPEAPPGFAEVIPGAGERCLRLHFDRLIVLRIEGDLPLVLGFREQLRIGGKRHPSVFDLLQLGPRGNTGPDFLPHPGIRWRHGYREGRFDHLDFNLLRLRQRGQGAVPLLQHLHPDLYPAGLREGGGHVSARLRRAC